MAMCDASDGSSATTAGMRLLFVTNAPSSRGIFHFTTNCANGRNPMTDAFSTWRAEELERVGACPACGSTLFAMAHEALRDGLEGVPGAWSMCRCEACGSFYLHERPNATAIGKAYASYYTHGDGAATFAQDNGDGALWKLANGYLNARYGTRRTPAWVGAGRGLMPALWPLRQQLDYFQRYLPRRPGRLLDVGCGNGVFLLRAQAAGWRVAGIEPDPRAVAAARRSGLDVQTGTLDDFRANGVFDVATASHVIEHVHEPGRFLEQIANVLRVGGTLWLATPNVAGPGHRHYGHAWRGLEPPRHLTIFSRHALQQLLERVGFTEIRFRRRGRGARYILQSSQALARAEGMRVRALPSWWVDLQASLSTNAGEELVVTARRAD